MFTRVHHIGLVVADLEPAKKLWLDTYGFSVDESRSPLPDGRNVSLDNVNILDIPVGESEIEINKANDPQSGTGRDLERRGQGAHHICLYSDDIDDDVKRLQDAGLQLIVPPTGSSDQKGGSRALMEAAGAGMHLLISDADALPSIFGDVADILGSPGEWNYDRWVEATIEHMQMPSPKFEQVSNKNQRWARKYPWGLNAKRWLGLIERTKDAPRSYAQDLSEMNKWSLENLEDKDSLVQAEG